jgi:dCMP deaminase
MCKKLIINAGIETVVIRNTPDSYKTVSVSEWLEDDDSLSGRRGY